MTELRDILWFVPSMGDTRFLGTQQTRRNTSHQYLKNVTQAIDSLGFSGALHPTGAGCEDSWVLASSMIPLTERMKFLIAFRPGSLSPTLAARMANTFDRFSDGRLLLNIITGGDPAELAGDGTFLTHDERYEVTDEFLTVWRALFTGEKVDFDGKHIQIKGGQLAFPPVQRPYPTLFFGGSSPAAIDVAGKHVDVYLTLGEPPEATAEKFQKVRDAAAKYGRTMRFGVRLHIIVRETADEAWQAANNLLKYATDDVIKAHQAKLAQFDSVGQGRMKDLHAGSRDQLEISPNLWAGIGLVNKGVGTALVGDPESIAKRLMEYVDLGADTFILSGYPHLEEAYRVSELLFPLLPDFYNKINHADKVFNPASMPVSWQ